MMNGFSPIIATSSLKHTTFLKSIGATHILDRALSSEKILDEVSNITGGAPLAYAFDVVSDKTTLGMAYDALALGGGLVSVLPGGSEPLLADRVREGDGKRVVHAAGSLHRIPANRTLGLEVYKRVSDWLKDGTLVVRRVLFPSVIKVLILNLHVSLACSRGASSWWPTRYRGRARETEE